MATAILPQTEPTQRWALRGRAATPVRPGILVKNVLSSKAPLITETAEGEYKEELVLEAAIVDLHRTYKVLVHRENELRPKDKRLKPMTYPSFTKLTKFAMLLDLVKVVREEPMDFPPPGGPLYHVVKGLRRPYVVHSRKKILALTDNGFTEEAAWGNLCKAWIEGWTIPSGKPPPVVMPPTAPEVPVKRRKPVERVEVFWKPIEIKGKPTTAKLKELLEHLQTLEQIGTGVSTVRAELDRVAMYMGDWEMDLEDDIETESERVPIRPEVLMRLTKRLEDLSKVRGALFELKLPEAIAVLERML